MYTRRPAVSQTRRRGASASVSLLGIRTPFPGLPVTGGIPITTGFCTEANPRLASHAPRLFGKCNDDDPGDEQRSARSAWPPFDGAALGGSSNGGPLPVTQCSTEVAATCPRRVRRIAHHHATAQSTRKLGQGGSRRGEKCALVHGCGSEGRIGTHSMYQRCGRDGNRDGALGCPGGGSRYPVTRYLANPAPDWPRLGTRPLRFSFACWRAPSYVFPIFQWNVGLPSDRCGSQSPRSAGIAKVRARRDSTRHGILVQYTAEKAFIGTYAAAQRTPVRLGPGRFPGSCRRFPHARPIPIPPQLAKPSSADVSPEV